jgi:hypothetical protein
VLDARSNGAVVTLSPLQTPIDRCSSALHSKDLRREDLVHFLPVVVDVVEMSNGRTGKLDTSIGWRKIYVRPKDYISLEPQCIVYVLGYPIG